MKIGDENERVVVIDEIVKKDSKDWIILVKSDKILGAFSSKKFTCLSGVANYIARNYYTACKQMIKEEGKIDYKYIF